MSRDRSSKSEITSPQLLGLTYLIFIFSFSPRIATLAAGSFCFTIIGLSVGWMKHQNDITHFPENNRPKDGNIKRGAKIIDKFGKSLFFSLGNMVLHREIMERLGVIQIPLIKLFLLPTISSISIALVNISINILEDNNLKSIKAVAFPQDNMKINPNSSINNKTGALQVNYLILDMLKRGIGQSLKELTKYWTKSSIIGHFVKNQFCYTVDNYNNISYWYCTSIFKNTTLAWIKHMSKQLAGGYVEKEYQIITISVFCTLLSKEVLNFIEDNVKECCQKST